MSCTEIEERKSVAFEVFVSALTNGPFVSFSHAKTCLFFTEMVLNFVSVTPNSSRTSQSISFNTQLTD